MIDKPNYGDVGRHRVEPAGVPAMKEEIDTGLLVLRKEGKKPPLFCIHGGGGDALDYEDLATSLPQDQPVYAFSLPALENRAHLPTVHDLASRYLSQIRNIQNSGPYQLCGHSFGGFVAYEIACRLMEDGQHVGVIALFDTPNPMSYRNISAVRKLQFHIVYLSNRVMRYGGNLLRGRMEQIIADAIAAVKHRGSRFVWTAARALFRNSTRPVPSMIHSDALVLNEAGSAFTPREYRGDVVLFRASIRDVEYKRDATLGWAECVSGCIHVQHVEGDHSSIMFLPNVKSLADMLVIRLAVAYDEKGNVLAN